jgi:hypothetical protein
MLVILSVAALFPSLFIDFVSDDISHINQAADNVFDLKFHYFRPISIATLILDKAIWGYNSMGFHTSNVVFHTVAVLLIYSLAFRFVNDRFFALIAALLFLLHPIHSISIFWISGRVDILCAIFYLVSFITFVDYTRGGNAHHWGLSIVCFVFALLSKEMAASLPFVLSAYLLLMTSLDWGKRLLHALKFVWPYWFVLIGYLLFRLTTSGESAFFGSVHTNLDLFQVAKNLAVFLGLLVIPGGHITIGNFLNANPIVFVIAAATVIGGLIIAVSRFQKQRELLMLIVLTLLMILPAARLTMRWYLYLPSIGFCLGLAYVLSSLKESKSVWKNLSYVLVGAILTCYMTFLFIEQMRWRKSGEIAMRVSQIIAEKVTTEELSSCFILAVPGEYQETPVLLHGIEELINYRLKTEYSNVSPVEIFATAYISLREDWEKLDLEIKKNGSRGLILAIQSGHSYFVFPDQADLISGRELLQYGTMLESDFQFTSIKSLNQRGHASEILVEFGSEVGVVFVLSSDGLEKIELHKKLGR